MDLPWALAELGTRSREILVMVTALVEPASAELKLNSNDDDAVLIIRNELPLISVVFSPLHTRVMSTINYNRPRDSLLSLFDPLSQSNPSSDTSETPPHHDRDLVSPSPSEGGSDKENSTPAEVNAHPTMGVSPMTFNKFFSRPYTDHNPLPTQVPLPLDRLIDFDVSVVVDDRVQGEIEESGDESGAEDVARAESPEEEVEDENNDTPRLEDNSVFSSTSLRLDDRAPTPRRPLADISLAVVALSSSSPAVSSSSPTKNSVKDYFTSRSAPPPSPKPTRAPESSRLFSVMDSINSADGSPSSSPNASPNASPPMSPIEEHARDETISQTPKITVHSPASLEDNSDTLSPLPTAPIPRLRSHISHTSTSEAFDPRRVSVDLQSSFSSYIACPESSFDLLNDRISFINHDSFLGQLVSFTDGDAEFADMDVAKEEEEMEELVAKLEGLPSFKNRRDERKEAGSRATKSSVADLESRCAEAEVSMLSERLRDVRVGLGVSESELKEKREAVPRPQRQRKDRSKLKADLNMEMFVTPEQKRERSGSSGSDEGRHCSLSLTYFDADHDL